MPTLESVRKAKERTYIELEERMKRANQMKRLVSEMTVKKAIYVSFVPFFKMFFNCRLV